MRKCKEASKLRIENSFLLKKPFIWSKIYRVFNHLANWQIWARLTLRLAIFLKRSNFSGNFEQRVDGASHENPVIGDVRLNLP